MKKNTRILAIVLPLFIFLEGSNPVTAQAYYGVTSTGVLYSFFPGTCKPCPVLQLEGITPLGSTFTDIYILPNGNIVVTQQNQISQYSIANPNPISTLSVSGTYFSGSAMGPGGLIYVIGGDIYPPDLYTYDPINNSTTLIGPLPLGITSNSDLYFFNGQLYAVGFNQVIQVNTSNPAASTILNISSILSDEAITDGGFFIGMNAGSYVYGQFNPLTGVATTICDMPPDAPTFVSLQLIPAGVPQPPPCCTTYAGTLDTTTIHICIPNELNVPHNGDDTLETNDVLQFILFSNLNNPMGSILVQSDNPQILYNPSVLQTNVMYYVAAIAGDNLNGNVNMLDPCFDQSNITVVIWHPLPGVTYLISNPNVCTGACLDLTATFTGTSPFILSANLISNNNVIGNATQSFNSTTGNFVICIPNGALPGNLQIQTSSVTDAWCICN